MVAGHQIFTPEEAAQLLRNAGVDVNWAVQYAGYQPGQEISGAMLWNIYNGWQSRGTPNAVPYDPTGSDTGLDPRHPNYAQNPMPAPGSTGTTGSGGTSTTTTSSSSSTPTHIPDAPTPILPPDFAGPPPFAYGDFKPPSEQELYTDPSFKTRFNNGIKAIEMSKAAQGKLRTGGTMKEIGQWGMDFASQEYGDWYDRKFNEWNAGRAGALEAYRANHGVAADVYDKNLSAAQLRYAPQLLTWQTRTNAADRDKERSEESNWRREVYDKNLSWDKERYDRDSAWRRYTYGTDDAWRRYVLEEERRRFLSNQGLNATRY
jgi:hypothetical protein